MLKRIAQVILSLLLPLAAPLALAAELAPDAQMKAMSEQVIGAIKKDKEILAGNPKRIAELVETKILPHFDFVRMTQMAMGPNWRRATREQQEQLTREFRTLLVHTYSGALTRYRDQTLDFKPARVQPGDSEVTVRSELRQPGAQAIAIDYQMQKEDAGWKVYDVKVGGVSLVTTYRDTFTDIVRSRGVDALVESLGNKNRENGSAAASKT